MNRNIKKGKKTNKKLKIIYQKIIIARLVCIKDYKDKI